MTAMSEICFRYPTKSVADAALADLGRLNRVGSMPHVGEQPEVLHVPDDLWEQPFVPEIALGMGGRVTPCKPVSQGRGCALEETT
jgi:hypothetical protein